MRCRSLANFSCISFTFGCMAFIALSWRLWRTVSGNITTRTRMVKISMLTPKLLKKT